jgi:hypothetical protein
MLAAGRLPDPAAPDEVLVDAAIAATAHIGVGTALPLRLLTTDQFLRFGTAGLGPVDSPVWPLRVVGLVRTPQATADGLYVFGTPALGAAVPASYFSGEELWVRLGRGTSADAFVGRATSIATAMPAGAPGGEQFTPLGVTTLAPERHSVQQSNRPVIIGLLLLSAIALAVTALAVFQASRRHYARQRDDDEILVGLGVVRRQRLGAAALAAVLPAAVAAVTAFVAATIGSRWMPIGHARQLEPSPGFTVDLVVLVPGVLVLGALIVAAGALGRARVHVGNAARRDRRQPIRAVGRLADAGVAPPLAVDAQLALEPGAGRSAVPVRSALVGTTIGVTAVVAAATFGASLVRFLDTPARWGQTYDVAVADVVDQTIAERLADDHDTAAFAVLDVTTTTVEGESTSALAIQVHKGSVPLETLSGRMPVSPDEVALGSALLHDLGKRVGDEVTLGSAPHVVRIVGDVVPPPDASNGSGSGRAPHR